MIDFIQEAHICNYYALAEFGIYDIAFPYQDALLVMQTCRILGISIWGGYVYHKNDSSIGLSCDNWYYDKNPVVSDMKIYNSVVTEPIAIPRIITSIQVK
ncbi:hypothetical protein HMPREF2992_00570 [Prevotella sp. HMSC069G02]|nr:hypothetical protein HMPREF2992_00570 [Prevotella sp. HMSC069G02]